MCLPAIVGAAGSIGTFLQANQLLISAASTALSFVSKIQEQQNARDQAKRQNEIAFANRLNKERAEGLRIRQIRDRENAKRFQTSLEGREARATVRTAAEGFGGGVLNRLVQDYFRQEGRYNSSVLANLEQEKANSQQNFNNFVTGQEAQSAYVPQVNYFTTFASAATAFGQDYLDYRSDQLAREQAEKIAQQNIGIN
jgi:hypothetical protein